MFSFDRRRAKKLFSTGSILEGFILVVRAILTLEVSWPQPLVLVMGVPMTFIGVDEHKWID